MSRPSDYASLLPFAESDRQREVVEACVKTRSYREAAKLLGVGQRNVLRLVTRVRQNATKRGHSPEHDMTHTCPDGFAVNGVSTLYNADGKVSAQWVKTNRELESKQQAWKDTIAACVEECKGLAKPVKAPEHSVDDLMTVYPIGDAHVGLYAYAKECGEDFDCNIARTDLLSATTRLVAASPASKRAILVNVGDWYHADSTANTTTAGTRQDVDTRWGKVFRVGWMLMVDLIRLALEKHQVVEVVNARGNHDEHTAQALSEVLYAWFHNEPRVVIHENVAKFHYLEFGKVLLGVTHGDTIKATDLDSLMAADVPEMWGRTLYRHWLTGHIHHKTVVELRGATSESFNTLAAKDAYHHSHGYRAQRSMSAIVYHREFGEDQRYRCDIRLARRQ